MYELLRVMDLGRPKLGSGGTQKYSVKQGIAPKYMFCDKQCDENCVIREHSENILRTTAGEQTMVVLLRWSDEY